MNKNLAYTESRATNLQEHLSLIRKICGYSSDALAKELGVSRSTIVHLETKNTDLSPIYFYSLSYILFGNLYSRKSSISSKKIMDFIAAIFNNSRCLKKELAILYDIANFWPRKCGIEPLGVVLRNKIIEFDL